MNGKCKLIAVSRVSSKGTSYRITHQREVGEKLGIGESEHMGFYEKNGEIVVRKIE